MKKIFDNWVDYWNSETIFDDIMKKSMEIFTRTTMPLLNYNHQDIVLDIGCGPGYLEVFLKDKVKEIHCLDTSDRYLDICRKKFKNENNIFFYKLDNENYTDFPFFQKKKFSIIICNGVIHYYKSISDVEKLIKEVKLVALPGARFLITDIMDKTGILSDAYSNLKAGIRGGFLLESLKFLIRAILSEYSKTRASLGFLFITTDELNRIINKLNLNATVINERLTIHENRKHLLIKF